MEILNQTNRYIEELGEKVCIQKHEVDKLRKGTVLKNTEDGNEDESDEEQKEEE